MVSASALPPGLAFASLQISVSLWAVSFLVVSVLAAHEGQRALVHTMHVQPSFPPHDVTAHSDEHDSHGTPCSTVTSTLCIAFTFLRAFVVFWSTSAAF